MKHLQDITNQNQAYSTQAQKHIILPPPYSPELNPIEQTWATIKKWLRSHLAEFETIKEGLKCYVGVWGVYIKIHAKFTNNPQVHVYHH